MHDPTETRRTGPQDVKPSNEPPDKPGPGDNLITNPLDKPGARDNLIPNPLDKPDHKGEGAQRSGEAA